MVAQEGTATRTEIAVCGDGVGVGGKLARRTGPGELGKFLMYLHLR